MKYTLIKTSGNGTATPVTPKKKSGFTLEELQEFVGGTVDIKTLPNGNKMYLNDNGKLDGLPKNVMASRIWQEAYPIDEYPHNNDGLIVGDVLYAERDIKKKGRKND